MACLCQVGAECGRTGRWRGALDLGQEDMLLSEPGRLGGDVAQLGERVNRTHEVGSSNLLVSTRLKHCLTVQSSFIPLRVTERPGTVFQKAQAHTGQKACAEQAADKAP